MIIRRSTPGDGPALMRLEALDSRRLPCGDALVAEIDGRIHAAVSLADGTAVADPFRHTAHLVDLLTMRAAQIEAPAAPRRTLRARLLPHRSATADA